MPDSLNNDRIPDESETIEEQQSIVIEPKKPVKENENEPEPEQPKEDSPVIVHADEPIVVTAEPSKPEPPKPTKEEIEAAEKKREEEEKLNKLINKYDQIAQSVSKLKKFDYKNGKIKVTVIKATNVDDKDIGIFLCTFVVYMIFCDFAPKYMVYI